MLLGTHEDVQPLQLKHETDSVLHYVSIVIFSLGVLASFSVTLCIPHIKFSHSKNHKYCSNIETVWAL